MDGIFPFVCAALRRRRTRPPDSYQRLAVPAAAKLGPEHARFGGAGACNSQSCRFPARRPTANDNEPSLHHHDDDDRPPPDGELSPAPGGRGLSRSRRFGSMRMLASCIGGP